MSARLVATVRKNPPRPPLWRGGLLLPRRVHLLVLSLLRYHVTSRRSRNSLRKQANPCQDACNDGGGGPGDP
ncbi:hypothetical protein E2C01_006500 [Portunus trituberculatus]|uniref:Uncharacterized protein n=1 Tax=Portunus trituberculatus TaxID=210409 RepID=A0A5B7CZQ0_PORTR|nr:hypothetical protein [Portunus trituberculatus]